MSELTELLIDLLETEAKKLKDRMDEVQRLLETVRGKSMALAVKTEPANGQFSDQEKKILALIGQRRTNDEIAEEMKISKRTVEGYRYQLAKRMGVKAKELRRIAEENARKA